MYREMQHTINLRLQVVVTDDDDDMSGCDYDRQTYFSICLKDSSVRLIRKVCFICAHSHTPLNRKVSCTPIVHSSFNAELKVQTKQHSWLQFCRQMKNGSKYLLCAISF